MTYKITINNPGKHIHNPLLKLAGREYATREEACEAIYGAMYDVITGEGGCEMVDKSAHNRKPYWVLAGEGERGTWHRIVTTQLGIKQHLTKERCGGDRWATAITDIYRTHDDTLAGIDIEANAPVDAPDEAEYDCDTLPDDTYIDDCHAYILREGYASEDGVTANVEEITNA